MAVTKKDPTKLLKAKKPLGISRGLKEIKNLIKAAELEKTTLDTLYVVDMSDKVVTLSIEIGDSGQTSNMTIMLDNKTITSNQSGNFPKTNLGTNKELNGKKLSIVANIADTSKETNLTSLTINLTGGQEDIILPLSKTVEADGESEDYLCLIEFFNPNI